MCSAGSLETINLRRTLSEAFVAMGREGTAPTMEFKQSSVLQCCEEGNVWWWALRFELCVVVLCSILRTVRSIDAAFSELQRLLTEYKSTTVGPSMSSVVLLLVWTVCITVECCIDAGDCHVCCSSLTML